MKRAYNRVTYEETILAKDLIVLESIIGYAVAGDNA